ncbi:anti-sigma-D factor RsdA [[Mycobacterium] burgundiense]|uniref:Anti-sigma-D factor RsdA n=1 Tax=[Mycobacterium] burgundiense TaxID=3064286 RepID=A0ABN9NKG2_9MYCO|nr:anti-sigma-D factor RsdA [Mycolicibacterium sp. MU0053]CAJ1507974.1 anti-sigma-D factor RsdA [Mycolicibacterium sp. MU0053]
MPSDFRDSAEPESLAEIAATDQLLDALADQRRVRPADRADAELFALLEDWRDGVRGPSVRRFLTEDEAAAAVREGLAVQTAKPGPRRGLTIVASLAAGVLAIGGFGALVGGAQPGDSMYGLRTALFGESQAVRDDRVTLAAQTQLAEVQQLIERGDWEQAQAKLEQVSTEVQTVDDVENKTDLIQQWNELSVKVGTRDANAALPEIVPGAPSVPPPPGVTLLELPALVAPTTTAPSDETTTVPSETATTSESPPGESSPEPTTEPSAPTTAPSTEPGAQPSAEPTTTPTPEPTTAPPAATTTPTSATATKTSTTVPPSSSLTTTTAPRAAEPADEVEETEAAESAVTSAPTETSASTAEIVTTTTTVQAPLIEAEIPEEG